MKYQQKYLKFRVNHYALTLHFPYVYENFSILPPVIVWSVKNFPQISRIDPMDFLNLHKISFPTVYNMSLSKFFLG